MASVDPSGTLGYSRVRKSKGRLRPQYMIHLQDKDYRTILEWIVYIGQGGLENPISAIPFSLLRTADLSPKTIAYTSVFLAVSAHVNVGVGINVLCLLLNPAGRSQDNNEGEADENQISFDIDEACLGAEAALGILRAWKSKSIDCLAPHKTFRQFLLGNDADWVYHKHEKS